MDITKYLNFMCFSGKYAPNSSLNYLSDLNQAFSPFLQGHFFQDIGQNCIFFKHNQDKNLNASHSLLEFIRLVYKHSKSKLADLSPTSRRRKLSALKNFSKWCLEQELIQIDPLRSAPSTKLPDRLPEYLNLDEILLYFNSLKSDYKSDPTKYKNEFLNFLVLYGCGLRTEEACNIKIKDIDWSQSRILILGKGSKERFAILPEFVKVQLQSLLDLSGIYLYGDKPLIARTAYNWIKKRALKAGLHKPVHPHMFRHTYATHLLREKTDLRHLQELLGHSSLVATQRYTHLDKDQLLKSLEDFHPLSKE